MEQFSLEKYLANPSRRVVTRAGNSVRIICTDRKAFQAEPSRKVIGLVDMSYCEEAKIWYEKGNYYANSISSFDLFFAPEKHEGWVNLYKGLDKDHTYYLGDIYNSKAEAENKRDTSDNYVATIKFEWEE